MLQLILIIFILLKIHYYNKPIKGNSVMTNGSRIFAARRINGSGGSSFSLFLIGFSVLGMFVMGILTVHNFKLDGAYAFYGRSIDLNEYVRSGSVPEPGSYVSVKYNMVGEEFYPIAESNPGVYFPVVLEESRGSSSRPSVMAVYVDKKDEGRFKTFIEMSKDHFDGTDDNKLTEIRYTGRIVELIDEMPERYNDAIKESGINETDYIVRPMVINTRISQEKLRKDLIRYLSICHALFTLAFLLFINYLIDEGKLD